MQYIYIYIYVRIWIIHGYDIPNIYQISSQKTNGASAVRAGLRGGVEPENDEPINTMGDVPGLGISRRKMKSMGKMRWFCCRFDGKAYCTDVTDCVHKYFKSWKQGLPQNQVVIRMKEKCHVLARGKTWRKKNVSLRVEMGSLCWSKDIYRRHAHCFAVCTRVGILRLRIQLSCSWRRDRTNPFPNKLHFVASLITHCASVSIVFVETNTRVPGLHAPSAVGNLLMNLSKSAMIVVASWPSTTSSLRQSSPKLLSLKPHGFEHYFWI